MTDEEDYRRDALEAREVHCKCNYPDMPGICPGWQFCPMCEEVEDEA